MSAFAELVAATNFSFLRGASHPHEMVGRRLNWASLPSASPTAIRWPASCALTWQPRKPASAWLVGARLVTTDGFETVCYPTDRAAYGRLCRLLTHGNRRAPKGQCHFTFEEMLADADGQIFIVVPPRPLAPVFTERLRLLAAAARGRVYLAATFGYRGDERRRLASSPSSPSRPARRSSPPTMCSITTRRASRWPTCSPASARNARLRRPASAWKPMPSGI